MALDQDQRDVLYEEVVLDLRGLSDVTMLLDHGRGGEAQTFRQQFEDDFRLLDDLGWNAAERRERYELTMPAMQQARIMRRFYRTAMGTLRDLSGFGPQPNLADDDLDLMSACRAILPELARKAEVTIQD